MVASSIQPKIAVSKLQCHHCRKKGHIAKVCRSKNQRGQHQQGPGSSATAKPGRTRHVDEVPPLAEVEDSPYSLYHVSAGTAAPICVTVKVNGANLKIEMDTGASLSLISEATYRNLWQSNRPQLQPTEKVLSTYTGESLEVLGSLSVLVEYGEQKSQLEMLIIAGSGPSLLGRDWLLAIKLDWSQLHLMTVPSVLHKVLQKHTTVFKDELGEVKDPQARPRFCKPCTVPYALWGKVEQELDRLERDGIIQPEEFSEWAVVRTDHSICICGDYIQGHCEPSCKVGHISTAPCR